MSVGERRRLRFLVRLVLAGEALIDPHAVEIFHQRPIEHVDPDHRIFVFVAVVVPGAVRREHDVAAAAFAALALDIRVAAFVRQDRAARVRAVHMGGRDVAGVVDGDRAADGVGDLQPPAQSGIGQQDALAVGGLQRLHLGVARDLGDLEQKGADLAPAPAMRLHLHLIGGDASLGEVAGAGFTARIREPGPLRRRVRLGADPGVQLRGFGVELVHQLGRTDLAVLVATLIAVTPRKGVCPRANIVCPKTLQTRPIGAIQRAETRNSLSARVKIAGCSTLEMWPAPSISTKVEPATPACSALVPPSAASLPPQMNCVGRLIFAEVRPQVEIGERRGAADEPVHRCGADHLAHLVDRGLVCARGQEFRREPAADRRLHQRLHALFAGDDDALFPLLCGLGRRGRTAIAGHHAVQPVGMFLGERNRGHAAHRHADEMRALDLQRVEQTDDVGDQQIEAVLPVGRIGPPCPRWS